MDIGALIGKFKEVALDRIETMNLALLSLEREGTQAIVQEDLLREVHTLKGEAKMLGFADINLVAHQIESILVEAASQDFQVHSSILDVVFRGFDVMRMLLTKQIGASDEPIDLASLSDRITNALSVMRNQDVEQIGPQIVEQVSTGDDPQTPALDTLMGRPHQEQSIRVRHDKIELLGELTAELLMLNHATSLQHEQVNDVRRELAHWLDHAPSSLPKSQRTALRRLSHKLNRAFLATQDGVSQTKQRISQVDEQVRRLRHISLEQVTAHYSRAVRDLAHTQGKEVRFVQEIEQVEVDRVILSSLSDPLLHLLRNAVDHGVESPEDRASAGKPQEATITLTATQEHDTLRVCLRDDGAGMDPEALRSKAVERGMMDAASAASLSDKEALALIFASGFSTKQTLTDVSGRGLGMNIVQRHVRELGGSVDVHSVLGEGTSFTLALPLPSALSTVLVFHMRQQMFALYAHDVQAIVHRQSTQVRQLHGAPYIKHDEAPVAVVDWARVCVPDAPAGASSGIYLVLTHQGDAFAVEVDDIVGDVEAMTRPLDDFLRGMTLCQGVAIVDTDHPIPLLSVMDVTSRVQGPSALDVHTTSQERTGTILLAEDSEVTRTMIASILKAHGYHIMEAPDGLHAWEMLQQHHVDLLITDMQMPRLGGLGLLEHVRSSPSLKTLPVVVLSTLGSAQDKAQAMQRGADMYLVKLDFREKELLQAVKRYV